METQTHKDLTRMFISLDSAYSQTGSNPNVYQANYDIVLPWNILKNKNEQITDT